VPEQAQRLGSSPGRSCWIALWRIFDRARVPCGGCFVLCIAHWSLDTTNTFNTRAYNASKSFFRPDSLRAIGFAPWTRTRLQFDHLHSLGASLPPASFVPSGKP
jgi:hypothetical protein